MPIAARRNPEDYKRKSEALTSAKAELQKNVERLEQYSIEFADLTQNCIDYLAEYRSCELQQLQTEKEEMALAIETAIHEVTSCLDQGIEPVSALAQAVWVLHTEELQMFSYTMSVPDFPSLFQSCVHYQNNLKSLCERFNSIPEDVKERQSQLPQIQVPGNLFAAIFRQRMELYDFTTQKATQHQLPFEVWSGYVQVDRTTVLIVGQEVRTLDLLTLHTTPLAPLLTPRDCVGVAQVGNTVFAFGGYHDAYGNPVTICEKSTVPPTLDFTSSHALR